MIQIFTKRFNQLSKNELYKIFQIRSKVFIVEQNCIYQDIDFKDQKAHHILIKKNKEIIGYSRIFKSGDYFKKASIGRVVISKENREKGYGKILMKESIKAIEHIFKEKEIKISAQKYLLGFYTSIGFKKEGKEYLEDGIPHIAMVKN